MNNNPVLNEFEVTLSNAIDKAFDNNYLKFKRGRKSTGRNTDGRKTYERITISVTIEQKNQIQDYAKEHYDNNVSQLFKDLLLKEQIIKGSK